MDKHYSSDEETLIEEWERDGVFAFNKFSPSKSLVGMPSHPSDGSISTLSGAITADVIARLQKLKGFSTLLPLMVYSEDWALEEKSREVMRRIGISYDRAYQLLKDDVAELSQKKAMELIEERKLERNEGYYFHCIKCKRTVNRHETKTSRREKEVFIARIDGMNVEIQNPAFIPMIAAILAPPSENREKAVLPWNGKDVPVIIGDTERPVAIDFSTSWQLGIIKSNKLKPSSMIENGHYVSGMFEGFSLEEAGKKALEMLVQQSILVERKKRGVVKRVHSCGGEVFISHSSEWVLDGIIVAGDSSIKFPWLVCRNCGNEFMAIPLSDRNKCPSCGMHEAVAPWNLSREFAKAVMHSVPCNIKDYDFRVVEKSMRDVERAIGICSSSHEFSEKTIKGSDRREMKMEFGNVVRADKTMLKKGADYLRIASILSGNQRNPVFRLSHLYFGLRFVDKLWNLGRYLLISNPDNESTNEIDDLLTYKLSLTARIVEESVEAGRPHKALHQLWQLIKFISSYYIPLSRHRKPLALRNAFLEILSMASIFAPFVSESLYKTLFKNRAEKSVFHLKFPAVYEMKKEILPAINTAIYLKLGRRAKALKGIPERDEIYEIRIDREIGYEMRECLGKALNAKNVLVGSDEWTVKDWGYMVYVG